MGFVVLPHGIIERTSPDEIAAARRHRSALTLSFQLARAQLSNAA
jgi:hypothetical protein